MIHRYAEWTRRQANAMNCSPALGAAFVVIGLGVVCFLYREVILKTLEIAALVIICAAAITGLTLLILSSVRYYRRIAAELENAVLVLPEHEPTSLGHLGPATMEPRETTLSHEEAITREADWLAASGDNVELTFAPDGKTLIRVKEPTE